MVGKTSSVTSKGFESETLKRTAMDDEEQRSLNRRKSVEAVNHSRKRKRDREFVGEEEHPGENAKSRRIRIALDNCGVIAERSHGAHSLVRITQSTSVQYPVGAVVLSINSEPTTSMNNEEVLTLLGTKRTTLSIEPHQNQSNQTESPKVGAIATPPKLDYSD
jgi:hypothetical protein